jgi:hypothetical protein
MTANCMADTTRAAFSKENAALSAGTGARGACMVEILFMAELVRRPLQAMARRWYCRGLFRATRGHKRCGERTVS